MPKRAPQRELKVIDWNAMHAAQAAANAEIIAVDEAARARRVEEIEARDPFAQLVKRCGQLETIVLQDRKRIEALAEDLEDLRQQVGKLSSDRPAGGRKWGRRQ